MTDHDVEVNKNIQELGLLVAEIIRRMRPIYGPENEWEADMTRAYNVFRDAQRRIDLY